MVRFALASCLILSGISSSWADVALPPDEKYIDPTVQFNGLANLPGYVVQLRFQTFEGGPKSDHHEYRSVADGVAFPLKANRRLDHMQLLVMKRADFEAKEKADRSLQWLTAKTPGVLAASVEPPSTKAKVGAPIKVNRYRVEFKDGKMTVTAVQDVSKSGVAAPLWRTRISAIALSATFAAFGLWLLNILRARRAMAPVYSLLSTRSSV